MKLISFFSVLLFSLSLHATNPYSEWVGTYYTVDDDVSNEFRVFTLNGKIAVYATVLGGNDVLANYVDLKDDELYFTVPVAQDRAKWTLIGDSVYDSNYKFQYKASNILKRNIVSEVSVYFRTFKVSKENNGSYTVFRGFETVYYDNPLAMTPLFVYNTGFPKNSKAPFLKKVNKRNNANKL